MSQATERIHELVDKLNQYRNEYYNQDAPSVSDAVYDRLYDELELWEKDTGIILSNSPTQTVGYKAVSSLEKVRHDIPLLSLAKTKQVSDLASFLKGHGALLMLKLDGLTVKLVYENGRLVEGSTRGDGEEGELITHNVAAFRNVPLSIPYKGRLAITGEGFIHKSDFERLKGTLTGSDGKPYRNARNLASGSIRCLDAGICREREVSFCAFNVLEGLDEFEDSRDSRSSPAEHPGRVRLRYMPCHIYPSGRKGRPHRIEDPENDGLCGIFGHAHRRDGAALQQLLLFRNPGQDRAPLQ